MKSLYHSGNIHNEFSIHQILNLGVIRALNALYTTTLHFYFFQKKKTSYKKYSKNSTKLLFYIFKLPRITKDTYETDFKYKLTWESTCELKKLTLNLFPISMYIYALTTY